MSKTSSLRLAASILVLVTTDAIGQDGLPWSDKEPFLRVEAGGPRSYSTALAFDPTGHTLYAAGWDKVIHVWQRDPQTGRFVLQPNRTYRVPVGPGLRGAINAMSVSHDGRWLAAAGHGVFRGGAGFRRPGRVVPSEGLLTPEMRRDEGVIFVFDTREKTVRMLRGHAGSVLSMIFAPGAPETPVLISAAREWQEEENESGRFVGAVRIWDVLNSKHENAYISERYLPEPRSRPGLAVRRSGPGLRDLQLSIAWGDEKYRLWDVAGDDLQVTPCGKYCNTVAFVPSLDGFVSGVFNRSGQLEFRRRLEVQQSLSLDDAAQGKFFIPRAIASGVGNPQQVVVAAVSRIVGQRGGENPPDKYVLQLASLADGKLEPAGGRSTLWNVPPTGALPAIAVSPDGELAAVVGDSDQSIWLYQTKSIRQGGAPFQILRNSGSSWQDVSFATRGNHKGLVLRSRSARIVFDLSDPRIVADTKEWEKDSPTKKDWRIKTLDREDPVVLVVLDGNTEISRVTLPEGEAFSTHAFLDNTKRPAQAAKYPALLALASHELGQATLRLYNAETGEAFRQLTGHTQTIDAVSFSGDGRLLASVAGDQTICLWSLSDLETILGRHGMLAGVAVKKTESGGKEEVVVTRFLAPASASIRGALSEGDILRSLAVEGAERKWLTVREFFDAFWSVRPGTQAKLRIQRSGKDREVSLSVDQAVDERKPMLSLFLTSPDDRRQRQWIAWTPLGPYQASGRAAESYLGWHFNTDDPAKPTRFAAAEEYRETYYRDGLVNELIEHGVLQEHRPEPPAAITMLFDSQSQQHSVAGGALRIRRPPQELHLSIADFPSDLIESIEVAVDGSSVGGFSRVHEDQWMTELKDLDWKRGTRRFRTVVNTNETPPRQFTRDTSVHYVPLPPSIESSLPSRQVVRDEQFQLRANIESPDNERIEVRVRQNDRLSAPLLLEGDSLDRHLVLQPGDNLIELVATNRAASEETRDDEATRTLFHVTYVKAKALTPEIALKSLQSLDKKTGPGQAVWLEDDDNLLVLTKPILLVTGTIQSDTPIATPEWRSEKQPAREAVTRVEAASGNAWEFQQLIALEPGKQRLTFFAHSADSDEASALLTVEFRPPLPEIVFDPPSQIGLVELEVDDPPAEIRLSGKLILPDPLHPFDARVILNDEAVGSPTMDLLSGIFTAAVPLGTGQNRISIVLTNKWRTESTSETRFVECRRYPRIVDAKHTAVGPKPFTNVSTQIESPVDRPLTQVSVGDRNIDPSTWEKISVRENVEVWRVVIQDVPLEPGENRIEVVASNADGPCRRSKTLEIGYDAALWAPPAIDFLNAAPGGNVTASSYDLRFQVSSASSLRDVRIEVNGVALPADSQTTEGPRQDADVNQWSISAKLALKEGVNRVAVAVKNDGGETRAERELSYVTPPVSVSIVSLEPLGDPERIILPAVNRDDQLVFEEPISSGYARLRGSVTWRDRKLAPGASPAQLKVRVDGFLQRPVALRNVSGEQTFQTVIVLGREKQNQVELDLVGAPKDAQSRLAFNVDCVSPRVAQRLHLLIVGVGKRDADTLTQRALDAIGAEADASGRFTKPLRSTAFHRINAYPALTGNVNFSNVFRLLLEVRANVQVPVTHKPTGEALPSSDLVMLYYEGSVLVPQKDHFILSTSEHYDPGNRFSAISSEWLAKFFDSMQGAQLALLDVSTKKPPYDIPVADWNHDSRAALLCYAWREGTTPPAELRLINAVEKATEGARYLGDVDLALDDISAGSTELDYSRVLPEPLRPLLLRHR